MRRVLLPSSTEARRRLSPMWKTERRGIDVHGSPFLPSFFPTLPLPFLSVVCRLSSCRQEPNASSHQGIRRSSPKKKWPRVSVCERRKGGYVLQYSYSMVGHVCNGDGATLRMGQIRGRREESQYLAALRRACFPTASPRPSFVAALALCQRRRAPTTD